jgi:hypothetical protein
MTCEVREVTKKTSAPLRRPTVGADHAKTTPPPPKRASCEAGCERSNTRALKVVAVAAAAAPLGDIHAKASKLRSRLRALKVVAVAAAAAPSGDIHAKASESGHLKRSLSSPLSRERSD